MKKVFLFLMFTSLVLGLFIGFREYMLSKENNMEILEPEVMDENYIGELKLPIIEIDNLNPLFTKNRQVSNTLGLIYEPLIALDNSNKLEATLATEWMEKDNLNWIIKLRENVKWHSEKIFSAEDVKFTIDTIINNNDSVYYENVKNSANVEIIDEHSISINLKDKDNF